MELIEDTFKTLSEICLQIQANIRDEDYVDAAFKLGIFYQICKGLFDNEDVNPYEK